MNNKQLVCRTCGKKYDGCKSNIGVANKWKKVACSPECYKTYIDKIKKSRTLNQVIDNKEPQIEITHELHAEKVEDAENFCGSELIVDEGYDEDEEDNDEYLDSFGE